MCSFLQNLAPLLCCEKPQVGGESRGFRVQAMAPLAAHILKSSQERSAVSSVQFSHSVVSNSLWTHGLQHTRLPCPSPAPRAYSNSCPWVGDAIQPSHPLSSLSPPAFYLSQRQGLFQWDSSSHQVPKYWSFSFNTSLSNDYSDWFPLGLIGWISLQSKGLSRVFSNTTVQKHQFFSTQLSL